MEPPFHQPCDSVGPSPAPPHKPGGLHPDHRQVELGAANRRPSDQPHVNNIRAPSPSTWEMDKTGNGDVA